MKNERTWAEILAFMLLAVLAAAVIIQSGGDNKGGTTRTFLSTLAATASTNPWEVAAKRVTEDRGEPTGRQAKVDVPDQLRHYSDRRRFLATQVAEWKEHEVVTPTDFAALTRMIRRGELVEVEPVTESYILFGVGASADEGLFTYYDKARGKRIELFDEAQLAIEYLRLEASTNQIGDDLEGFKKELSTLGKRERSRRTKLRSQISQTEKTLRSLRERKNLLDSYYGDEGKRAGLATDRELIASLASDFDGRTYDLNDPISRKEMKVRLLSHLRPEALSVLAAVADSYRQKFDRPLPITSLVRPDEYQRHLSKTNANATRINTPPHSTGLAFDIFYRHMTADEQEHVMTDLARLRDEGRIEALRENRDHFHVFVFVDGKRPDEKLIRASLDEAVVAKPQKAAITKASKKKSEKKVAKKTAVKKRKTSPRRRR